MHETTADVHLKCRATDKCALVAEIQQTRIRNVAMGTMSSRKGNHTDRRREKGPPLGYVVRNQNVPEEAKRTSEMLLRKLVNQQQEVKRMPIGHRQLPTQTDNRRALYARPFNRHSLAQVHNANNVAAMLYARQAELPFTGNEQVTKLDE